jgi:hypothetical protein
MVESTDNRRNSVRQLLGVAALMAVGYLCFRTLRFTNGGLNLVFVCAFLLLMFLAIQRLLSLGRWPRMLTTTLLTATVLLLLMKTACGMPDLMLSRELSVVQQRHCSVHLLLETGGGWGPHGVGLEQRMFILPGLYVVKYLDYFDGAHDGSLSVEAQDTVRLHVAARENWNPEINRVYALKPWVYF